MDKATIIARPLELANLYINGKGTLWNTLPEASRILSKTEPKVTLAQLKHAMTLSSFPPEILSLFSNVQLNTYTRKMLNSAKARFGIDVLVSRAASISPAVDDEERKWILRFLNGNGCSEVKARSALSLVTEYRAGLVSNRWKNVNQASKQLELGGQLYQAIGVLSLPKNVLELFDVKTLSLAGGRKLAKLFAIYGTEGILDRATWLRRDVGILSNDQKLAILSQANPKSENGVVVKARRTRKKLILEFHCPDQNGDLDVDLDAFQLIFQLSFTKILKLRKASHGRG